MFGCITARTSKIDSFVFKVNSRSLYNVWGKQDQMLRCRWKSAPYLYVFLQKCWKANLTFSSDPEMSWDACLNGIMRRIDFDHWYLRWHKSIHMCRTTRLWLLLKVTFLRNTVDLIFNYSDGDWTSQARRRRPTTDRERAQVMSDVLYM